MTPITQQDLEGILWNDFSILHLESGKDVLILVCADEAQSNRLMDILKQSAFDLTVFITKKESHFKLKVDFINSEYYIEYNTGATEDDYPPLKKLKNSQIDFISAGYWIDGQRGKVWYRKDLHPLGTVNLN